MFIGMWELLVGALKQEGVVAKANIIHVMC